VLNIKIAPNMLIWSRLITTVQLISFTVSTIARLPQKLAVSNMEITTLGTIFCSLLTAYFWWKKPLDVQDPVTIKCETPIETILAEAISPTAQDPYRHTPLDFVSREEWSATLLWEYCCNMASSIAAFFGLHGLLRRRTIRPEPRIPSINFPVLPKTMLYFNILVSFFYAAIFISMWNSHYPTPTERLLWRISSIGSLAIVIVVGLYETSLLGRSQAVRAKANYQNEEHQQSSLKYVSTIESTLQDIRNNSPDKDPLLAMPLRSILLLVPLCAVYVFFRAFILIEDLIGFREVPASVYKQVDWSAYLPHI